MRRGLAFGLLAALCAVVAVAYVAIAASRQSADTATPRPTGIDLAALSGAVIYRSAGDDASPAYGIVDVTTVSDRARSRPTGLRCDRVHFAAGRGLCLDAPGTGIFTARILDDRLRELASLRLPGLPSRARVSPDGRYGAVTAFVSGHSYAQHSFSTQTLIFAMARPKDLVDLERFTIMDGSRRLDSSDLNVWGTTFTAASGQFYATAKSNGTTYLIKGDVRSRRAEALHTNVECPSLSPDGTRVAYKKVVAAKAGAWQLHVLDLATMRETTLSEERQVDDQVEWLDDDRLLYGLGGDVWVARADGRGQPRRFIANAESPAVLRG
jgi:hypothetical protein